MRKLYRFLLLVLVIVTGSLFISSEEAYAADLEFLKEYSAENEYKEYDFRLPFKCRLTLFIDCSRVSSEDYDDWDDEEWDDQDEDDLDEFDTVCVSVVDADYEDVFEEDILSYGVTEETVTLPAGRYSLIIESDAKCTVTLMGNYIPDLSAKKMTLEAGKSKTLKVTGTNQKVTWKSSDNSIASVSRKGVVKAKKTGKAVITAVCGKKKLNCKVTVNTSYNALARAMRSYAGKNFTFKNVERGKKCRLYAKSAVEIDDVSSNAYTVMAEMQPYIQLEKNNKKVELSYKMDATFLELIGYDPAFSCPNYTIFTSNQKMDVVYQFGDSIINYDYSRGCYVGMQKTYSTIFKYPKVKNQQIKKFESILRQNSLRVKSRNWRSASFNFAINPGARAEWLKLLKKYRMLLKKY